MELKLLVPGDQSAHRVVQVPEAVFGRDYNEALVHQVVVAYLAYARAGTRAQKNRADVSGGGAKPWKQKGSGRARAGTTRGPIWRKGGVTFAAVPQDHSQKVNRSMYRGAMRSILSELVRQERLLVLESLEVSSPKTKDLLNKLKALNLREVLILTEAVTENLYLATRNLIGVEVKEVSGVDPVSLINYEKVLITLPALKELEERLA